MNMLVDTHCHLFSKEFINDIDEVVKRAEDAGVKHIIVPGTDIKTSKKAIELSQKYNIIYASVGVHPHDSKDWNQNWILELEELSKEKKVVAIGEIGLDYFYDFSPKEKQIQAFKDQIELAINVDLPVVVHNRDSDDDMMEIIKSYINSGLRAQFHCYNSTLENAIELINLNHAISFTGNITFKKFDELRNIVQALPLKKIFIETDAPYMTPVPFRGKRNEPANVKLVAEKVAEIKEIPVEEVIKTTSDNALKFFNIKSEKQPSYTYKLYNSLYINVTNRCNANCTFCDRNGDAELKGYVLKMSKKDEPSADTYISEIGDPKNYHEIVFCGYGEPTIRWDVVKEIAKYVKDNGGNTRLNTNGHGNVINKRDITPEMKDVIDEVSISLNSYYPDQYAALMRVKENMFYEMIDFARAAKNHVKGVTLSVVDIETIDKDKAREFAEKEVGVNFRIRPYF